MDNQLLKRRVVGAVVLVALGVIFIPMILSGGRNEMPMFGSNIPDKPDAIEKLRSLPIPKPHTVVKTEEIRIPVDERIPAANIEPNKTSTTGKTKPLKFSNASKASTSTKAWVVQVGSFSSRANALALQKKLRRHKFTAFVEFVKNKTGSVYRVRVGPETKRAKSVKVQQAILKKLEIKGMVLSHP